MVLFGCDRRAPIEVLPRPSFAVIAAGGAHSCAIGSTGLTYCWGRGGGQLGNGSTGVNWSIPQQVQSPPGITFTSIAAGGNHTCALTAPGGAFCWGANLFHQLGDGTNQTRTTPVPVSAPTGVSFSAISAGYEHSCALTSTGTAYCWGANLEGAVGDGTTTTAIVPESVAAPGGVTFIALSAGGRRTCGITPTNAAYCWGENTYGGVGDGTTESHTTPTLVQAPAGITFAVISSGYEHTCGLTASGAVYCWGMNFVGQLGDGSTTDRLTPVAVAAPAGVSFVAIDAGGYRTCAIATSQSTFCWGKAVPGDPSTRSDSTPVHIVTPAGVSFVTLDVGGEHTCALSDGGHAYCWGNNGEGQVGDGSVVTILTSGPIGH